MCNIGMLQNFNCVSDGPPDVGESVQVKWPDGDLYNATFRGTNSHMMYTVRTGLGEFLLLKYVIHVPYKQTEKLFSRSVLLQGYCTELQGKGFCNVKCFFNHCQIILM